MNIDPSSYQGPAGHWTAPSPDFGSKYQPNLCRRDSDEISMDDDGLDLSQNYQNAVDCLVHCEFIMKNLQDQLKSKDVQIASLEDKLVNMSLELASSKALQDEQEGQLHQLKRRISSVVIDDAADAYEVREETNADLQDTLQLMSSMNSIAMNAIVENEKATIPSLIVNYAPVKQNGTSGSRSRGLLRGNSRPAHPRSKSVTHPRSKSKSVTNFRQQQPKYEHQSEVMPWPSSPEDEEQDEVTHQEPTQRRGGLQRRGGFRLSRLSHNISQRMSWNIDESDTSTAAPNILSTLDDSQRSHLDHSAKGSIISAASLTDDSDPDSRKRLSNLGQYLLGLSKDVVSNTSPGDLPKGQGATTTENINFDGPSSKLRRNLSSRSLIEGVIFPVSSDDCLVGLEKVPEKEDFATSTRSDSLKRISLSYNRMSQCRSNSGGGGRRCSNRNAEWSY